MEGEAAEAVVGPLSCHRNGAAMEVSATTSADRSGSSGMSVATAAGTKNDTEMTRIALDDYVCDSDEEPESNDPSARLDWRLDPTETYSDWTIVISVATTMTHDDSADLTTSNSNVTDAVASNPTKTPAAETWTETTTVTTTATTYHVHKSILGLGDRRSEYFARLFQSGDRFAESVSKTSRIELDGALAMAFPTMLDYIYRNPDGPPQINTDNALPLYHLASYFEVRRLRWEAKQYWKRDLSLHNAHSYYEQGRELHDDKIKVAITDLVAHQVLQIPKESELLAVTEANFWRDVFHHPSAQAQKLNQSSHWSVVVAEFCTQSETLTAEEFAELTTPEVMGNIDPEAAQQLLVLEDQFRSQSALSPTPPPTSPSASKPATSTSTAPTVSPMPSPHATSTSPTGLSTLQQRCVRNLARAWASLDVDREETMEFLRAQNSALLTELFTLSTSRAQVEHMTLDGECRNLMERYEQLHSNHNSLRQRYESESMTQATTIREMERSINEWQRMHGSSREDLAICQDQVERLQCELEEMQNMDAHKEVQKLRDDNSRLLHTQASTMNDLMQCEQEREALEDELFMSKQREKELTHELSQLRAQLNAKAIQTILDEQEFDTIHNISACDTHETEVSMDTTTHSDEDADVSAEEFPEASGLSV